MSLPKKMRWHSYGAVDIAIVLEDSRPDEGYTGNGPDEPNEVTYAKYTQPIGRPGAAKTKYDERVFRQQTDWDHRDEDGCPGAFWVNAQTGERVPEGPPRNMEEAELDAPTHLFDAAATLCWHDYECFQACDAAMGDPYP